MTDETLIADPPEKVTESTDPVPAMADLAKMMAQASLVDTPPATDPLPPEGGKVEPAPVKESEPAPDKTVDDSAKKTEPDPKATPEPVTLTERQKQGAKVLRMTDEQLAALDDNTAKLLDEVGHKYQSAMGSIGNMVKTAKQTIGVEDKPDGGDGQEDPAAGTEKETPPDRAVDLATIANEFDEVDSSKLIEALQLERTHRTALETSLASVIEQNEQLLVDQFIGTLDPEAFAHLGKGPTWALAKDSPERKAREAMHTMATRFALGSEIVDGKPVRLIDALALTTNGAEQIRDSAVKRKAETSAANQRRAVHEPGRSPVATKDLVKDAMSKLGASMDKAGIYKQPGS